jgi:hypothetical protein
MMATPNEVIQREYLERLAQDFAAQIREHENDAAAARGALQVVQHFLAKYDEGVGQVPAPSPEEDIDGAN